ncbi:MAG: DNRLRE domain-containing protein [Candidatus Coatesbacteria bacterium]|nr:MAG: DNRLRE domain-containing protein [Candidatus Coatesbacteria bacterium]
MTRLLTITSLLIAVSICTALAITVELTPTDDAYIDEGDSQENYGGAPYAYIGFVGGYESRTLVLFDLSPYSGAKVTAATYASFVDNLDNICHDNVLCSGARFWDEYTVTWDNDPGYTTDISLNFGQPVADDWLSLDVTEFVENWLDGTYTNYGFYFIGLNPPRSNFSFRTKEYTDSEYHPKLTIDYYFDSVGPASLGEIKTVFR